MTLYVPRRKKRFTMEGWKEDTALGKVTKNIQKKTRFYRSTCSDKYTILYHCHGFSVTIQRWVIASFKINIVGNFFQLIGVLDSLIYFIWPVELILFLFSSYSIDSTLFQSLCLLCLKFWPCLVFIYCLNIFYDIPFRHISCNDHLHAYNRFLNMGMIWCKNKSSPLPSRNNYFQDYFSQFFRTKFAH